MAIKLLIVDDSAFMRKIIVDLVGELEGVEVVGIARNGLDALEIIPKLLPDIITLDVEMPKLNGIDTLKQIKKLYDIPVIMLSSVNGMDTTIEALQIGAIDFIEKPSDLQADLNDLKIELDNKIKLSVKKKSTTTVIKTFTPQCKTTNNKINAVVIGASTGGPKALVNLISKVPKDLSIPIFIVQHMPKGFTTSFAMRLDKESKVKVVEAIDGMKIENGTVYLAPGDFHMTLDNGKISLNMGDKIHGVRPAVDHLFDSAAKIYGDSLLAIIMTGMGRDGSNGMVSVKEHCGYNIAQNEETCVVYGMPASAVAKGVVHEILSLDDISTNMNKMIRVK